jgi:hypothetical protein
MKFAYLPLIFLFFLVGCAKEAPKCSDEKTLDLVQQILSKELSVTEDLSQKDITDNLKFEFPRATAYDKEIKKYSCDLKLVAGGSYQVPIKYESQLNDQDQHLVSVGGILAADVFQLKLALMNIIKKEPLSTNIGNGIPEASQSQANQSTSFISSSGITNTPFEKLLSGVYDRYLPSQKCWITTDENQQNYCMKIDSFEKVNAKGVNRFYAMLSGFAVDEKGLENGAHITSGMVAAFVMEENANQLNLIASDSKITLGAFGYGPKNWKLVKVGPDDYYGWKNQSGDAHGGYSGTFFHILAPYGARIKDIAGFISSASDEGACSEEPCKSTELNSSIEFDTSKTMDKVFPLLVTVKGKDKAVTIKDKKYNFLFDDKKWAYLQPNDYMLKDKEF